MFAEIVMLKKILAGVIHIFRPDALACASNTFLFPVALITSTPQNVRRMGHLCPTYGRLVSGFMLVLLACVFSSQAIAQTQIVNCDAPVQSRKRGIAVNSLSDADFRA